MSVVIILGLISKEHTKGMGVPLYCSRSTVDIHVTQRYVLALGLEPLGVRKYYRKFVWTGWKRNFPL